MDKTIKFEDGKELTTIKPIGEVVVRCVNKDTLDYVDVTWGNGPSIVSCEMLFKAINQYHLFEGDLINKGKLLSIDKKVFHYWYVFYPIYSLPGRQSIFGFSFFKTKDGGWVELVVDLESSKYIPGPGRSMINKAMEATGLTEEELYNPYNIQ